MAMTIGIGRVRPLAFFAGFAVGLVALALTGRSLPHADFARNFVRFHFYTGIETNYFPTALQLRALLLRREPSPEVVHVVVGGSSVFNGVGQHETRLWTRRLQDLLGERYLVTNVATRAGSPGDYGLVAMNMLLREGRRAIYVADGAPGAFGGAIRTSQYTYMLYDAAARGLLVPWPPRDRLLDELARTALAEPALGAWLNSWLSFNDFWGYIRYQHVSTVYHRLVPAHGRFRPLRWFGDPEMLPEQTALIAYQLPFEPSMAIVHAFARPVPPGGYDLLGQSLEEILPPQIRERTLAFVLLNSPYFVDRLSPAEQADYRRNAEATVAVIARTGVTAVLIGEPLASEDFIDRTHLAVSGGDKIAPIVAEHVRAAARRLGYAGAAR